jgi:hypothetical protein
MSGREERRARLQETSVVSVSRPPESLEVGLLVRLEGGQRMWKMMVMSPYMVRLMLVSSSSLSLASRSRITFAWMHLPSQPWAMRISRSELSFLR